MGRTTHFAAIFHSFPPIVSCLSTFYPCSFQASIVTTQTPHLSLVASDHFSCTQQQVPGQHRRRASPYACSQCASCQSSVQRLEAARKESPTQSQELQGGACSLIPWGWWIMQTLMSPNHLRGKAFWLPQFSQKAWTKIYHSNTECISIRHELTVIFLCG